MQAAALPSSSSSAEPDAESVARTRKMLLGSVWLAAASAVALSVAVALRSQNSVSSAVDGASFSSSAARWAAIDDVDEQESLAQRLARENDARTREAIRACFVDAIDAARAIQTTTNGDGAVVTDAMRGAFLRSTEELFTLERTYGRDRMVEEIGHSYPIAVRKLQAMLH